MGKNSSGVSAGWRVSRHSCEYLGFGDLGLDSGHTSVPNGSDRREDIFGGICGPLSNGGWIERLRCPRSQYMGSVGMAVYPYQWICDW